MDERPRNKKPTAAEWGLWRAWAARAGISQADITNIFGLSNLTYTRGQASNRLGVYAHTLEKAVEQAG